LRGVLRKQRTIRVAAAILTLSRPSVCLVDTNTNTKVRPILAAMAPAAAPEASYRKDEKVFCFHHELLYEAKVTDVKPNEGDDKKSGFQYKVHYKGWKNTYVFTLSKRTVCSRSRCGWRWTVKVTFAPRPHFDLEVDHFNVTAQIHIHNSPQLHYCILVASSTLLATPY
jgi:hypothetical protein